MKHETKQAEIPTDLSWLREYLDNANTTVKCPRCGAALEPRSVRVLNVSIAEIVDLVSQPPSRA